MGMVVRTNTMALNAYRQLGMNNSAVAKSLEKLASGYRINRAGDDAAGLAISEKMKAQIKGLETASANAQDGISLIQTAEGNLGEVHDMLNRMVELATKSANGTYTQTERNALQDEVNALLEEIDRISQSANFNGTNLLDGTMGLNKDAFTNITATAAQDRSSVSLTFSPETETDKTKLHLGTKAVTEKKPSFKINLGDLSIAKGGQATDTVELKIGSTTVTTAAIDATGADKTTDDIGGALATAINAANTNKGVNVGGVLYTAAYSSGVLTFTYAGDATKATGDQANTNPITDAMQSPSNDVTITMQHATGKGDYIHNTLEVENPVVKKTLSKAGIDITLDANVVKNGAKLTIDDKTYVFKTEKNSNITTGTGEELIDVTTDALAVDLNDSSKVIAAAVDLLSKKATTNFDISAQSNSVIHIDQKTSSTKDYDTYAKLTAVASAQIPAAKASATLTINGDKINSGDAINIDGTTYVFTKDNSTKIAKNAVRVLMGDNGADAADNLETALNSKYTVNNNNGQLTIKVKGDEKAGPAIIGGGLTLQIGDTADQFNKMTVSVADMSANGLGLNNLKITSETLSSDAIARIKDAINSVSTTRASMGALQNRLEHTINNLDVAAENLSAANSRIRDTDMAKEMMNYTKMNVLVQSAQAMLAQANQQPQSVLQLLQ